MRERSNRAVPRKGADVLIAYLEEHDDARETAHWVEQAGRRAALAPRDIKDETHCAANSRPNWPLRMCCSPRTRPAT